ncbi:tRNA pseudouridine(55) synthase TruB [Paenactinomyces guangxiensis]|uniref:tRNA pseudouridine synthase B n=1 Tax=Paenactinomyces guangxiensis TaxID=1490290 RepID=A0A7W1WQV7_9BACL|nr:tRNA pseudouridine(55) synthase TruB [Paenactinomyces guangxiensis]MBA4494376.1 tRNA pseudouridine(55) synthase TruB [Paenactinomyces guangxiensis]MBH8591569.1 tRNA pseudouridine(55) synthase TruB [Paenactinomyces guangxiensis]
MTIHGIIPVYKPKGYTSHDIVARVRRLAGQKKVGHTGTLDPEVEGVLPVCLGQATRLVEYIQEMPKRYSGSFMLGISTDTQDQTGTVLEKAVVSNIDLPTVEKVFGQFHGEIKQIPPMYSAVKVQGRRLYDLARSGHEVERPSRKVTIYQLICTGFTPGEYPVVHFDVICSKGTYIRTLCVDIGQALGVPAHMCSLTRTESGPFHLDDCYTLDELQQVSEQQAWVDVLTALDEVLGQFPSLIVSVEDAARVLDGWPLRLENGPLSLYKEGTLLRVYSETGSFCALYRLGQEGLAKPEKVFRDVES